MKLFPASELAARQLREDPLRDYFTWWDRIDQTDVDSLQKALDNATREEDMQLFLQRNPQLLIQHLGGGHGRWVIPKKKLGDQFITDFVIGQRSSIGFEWQAVELESPLKSLFNKNGDPSQHLNHAIRQIRDWRSWLSHNQNYASKSIIEHGLGLTDITADIPGLIIIGRRSENLLKNNLRRRQMMIESNIEIRTYDYLVDTLQGRVNALNQSEWRRNND
jgi:hypothetical protein